MDEEQEADHEAFHRRSILGSAPGADPETEPMRRAAVPMDGMRALLSVFGIATAAVTWAAGAHAPACARAASCDRPEQHAARLAPGANDWPTCDERERPLSQPPLELERATGATTGTVADIDLTWECPMGDGIPVDVMVIDGENSDVLRCVTEITRRGPNTHIKFDVLAPDGYVADSAGPRKFEAYVSSRAERLRVIEPLRREADICIRVLDPAGRPVEGAGLTEVLCGGFAPSIVALAAEVPEDDEDLPIPETTIEEMQIDLRARVPLVRAAPSGADGWMRVRGVPDLLDERYWIVARKGRREAFVDVLLGPLGQRHTLEVRLPVASTRPPSCGIGISGCGGCRSTYRCSVKTRRAPATLDVIVRRRDGRGGAGLEVHVCANMRGAVAETGVTDESGRVTFEGLRPTTYVVDVQHPDFVWSKVEVALGEGEREDLVFSEAPGWTARATLLDSVGRPVPFARVGVSSEAPVRYLRVEDGVQDLAFYTDARGEVRFPDMHHAPVSLSFDYGSRLQDVTLTESDPCATVFLPPP